ncbi:MAG: heavy metal-binding domain-containing protein [Ignavibacteria bacterium]
MNKLKIVGTFFVLIVSACFIFYGCTKSDKDKMQTEKQKTDQTQTSQTKTDTTKVVKEGLYVCPMHPLEQSNDPNAKCSVCKMDLISKKEHNEEMMKMHEGLEKKFAGKKDAVHFEVVLSVIKSDECERYISSALKKDTGVMDFYIDIINRVVHMYFDKSKTSKDKIEGAIVSIGFDANDKKADTEAAGKLPPSCK